MTFKKYRKAKQKIADEEYEARVKEIEAAGKDIEDEESLEREHVKVEDITQDYLTCDQSFIFSDEITIYHEKITEAVLVIVDTKVYLIFKANQTSIYKPFDL